MRAYDSFIGSSNRNLGKRDLPEYVDRLTRGEAAVQSSGLPEKLALDSSEESKP